MELKVLALHAYAGACAGGTFPSPLIISALCPAYAEEIALRKL